MPMSPRQSRSPRPSIHYKKNYLFGWRHFRVRAVTFRLPPGSVLPKGAATPKNIGRRARRMRGGNHDDALAIQGISD
jgi:hypothetical protein